MIALNPTGCRDVIYNVSQSLPKQQTIHLTVPLIKINCVLSLRVQRSETLAQRVRYDIAIASVWDCFPTLRFGRNDNFSLRKSL